MVKATSPARKYFVVAGPSALAGGLSVAITIKAVPRAMSSAMAGLMQQMMARMGEGEGHLNETSRKLMLGSGEAQE